MSEELAPKPERGLSHKDLSPSTSVEKTHESQDAVDPLDTGIFLDAGARKDGASAGPREVFKEK